MEDLNLKESEVLVLRKCEKDFTSRKGFKYPEKGYVEALDWKNTKECGNGLHGLEWGNGFRSIDEQGEIWQVLKVNKNNGYVNLRDGVKFRCGKVVLSTLDKQKAINLLVKYAPEEAKGNIGYQTIDVQNKSTVFCGNWSNIKSNDYSKIFSGFGSTITSGNWSDVISGHSSTITSGHGSTIISGNSSTVTIVGDIVTFTLGKGSRVMTRSSVFVEGVDFNANEKVIAKDGKIINTFEK